MIQLSWPAKQLSPNFRSRSHWPRTRALKQARSEGYWATKAAKVAVAAGDVPILLTVRFHPPTAHERDEDNLVASLKPYLDGIADALGVNDSLFRTTPVIAKPIKGGRVVVTIL